MIDTHCHIDLYPNPASVARKAAAEGVRVIAVTNLPSHFEIGRPHVAQLPNVRLALGLHPLLADQHREQLELFRRLLPSTSYVGEIGLDFSREGRPTKDTQLKSFTFVLGLLRAQPKFVSIHSRGAEEEVVGRLREAAVAGAVFHWYSGPRGVAEQALKLGHYFSINPAMVSSRSGRALVEVLPPDRVLTETDGPHVRVGRRRATPGDVSVVLTHLATAWGKTRAEVEHIVAGNLQSALAPVRASQA